MKTNYVFYLLCIMALMVGCTSTPTPSQATTDTPMPTATPDDGVIKLVTGEWEPFTGENLTDGGMLTEIVTLVFSEIGYEVKVDFKPWERAYEETKANIYPASFGWAYNDERAEVFYYSKNMISLNSLRFFVQADSDIEFTSIESLEGKKICRPQKWDMSILDDIVESGKVHMERPDDMESCWRMLQAKQVDMICDDEIAGWATAKNVLGTTEGFKTLEQSISEKGNYLLVSKTYPDGEKFLAEFDEAFAKLEKEGKIQAILDKYTK